MTRMENLCGWIRHRSPLRKATVLWDLARPLHDLSWRVFARRGIPRLVNGSDRFRISPRLRRMRDEYEPEVWRCLMRQVRPGDVFVDVGAFHGLYSIAVGQRVGPQGRVFAFEPDPDNYRLLEEHIRLNHLEGLVRPENKAVSAQAGRAAFLAGRGSESRLETSGVGGREVAVVALAEYLSGTGVDLLKIDVEGFEQAVLEGAVGLLQDPRRRPRAIFVEMHPFAWPVSGASSEAILALLRAVGYRLLSLDGEPMLQISRYGEAVAWPLDQAPS